jgi:hypothetical protein
MAEIEDAERAVIEAALRWHQPFSDGTDRVPNVPRITTLADAVSALRAAQFRVRQYKVTDHKFQQPHDGKDWCIEAVKVVDGKYFGACYRKRADHAPGGE